ncbi:GM22542 [Drosophila sechellia]|uniref:GM22542 n=1 Tax=Drosophila sechellia TaxID=7238 RepID=B4IK95_DROSE|nr:GM22542 [Drosophila sechellia]
MEKKRMRKELLRGHRAILRFSSSTEGVVILDARVHGPTGRGKCVLCHQMTHDAAGKTQTQTQNRKPKTWSEFPKTE